MNIFEGFLISLDAIWSNKMRSILTMLGLIIGISSVVTIVSLGDATEKQIKDELSSLGINKVTIFYQKDIILTEDDYFLTSDIERLENAFPEKILGITPETSRVAKIKENVEDENILLVSSNIFTYESENLSLLEGRFINDFDIRGNKKVVVIDDSLKTELFSDKSAIGEKIYLKTGKFTNAYLVIGVYETKESLMGFSDSKFYVPYSTINIIYNLKGRSDALSVTFRNDLNPTEEVAKLIKVLERFNKNVGENKYATFSAEEIMDSVSSALSSITIFVSAIAAISLVVGGIGVMNIMLVSVTERTREIGIRKALGAKYLDIMVQFLIEAVTISLLGGLIGSLLGMAFINIASTYLNISASLSNDSLILAVTFSSSIGIFFGIYPANKAANLNPIDALRYE